MDYYLSDSPLQSTTDTTDTCWNKVHFISLQVTGKKPNHSANATLLYKRALVIHLKLIILSLGAIQDGLKFLYNYQTYRTDLRNLHNKTQKPLLQ